MAIRCRFWRIITTCPGVIRCGEEYYVVGSRAAHVDCGTENLRLHCDAIMGRSDLPPQAVDRYLAEARRATTSLDTTEGGSLIFEERALVDVDRHRLPAAAMN